MAKRTLQKNDAQSLVPARPSVKAVRAGLETRLCGPAAGVGPLLAAVSGGADSVAMLRLLTSLAGPRGWEITAAHVDHGLRPDSGEDADFVRELAAGLGVGFAQHKVRVPKQGLSPEEAARKVRRAALTQMAHEAGAQAVVLAHTREDQAETLLMRFLSGTGTTGLAGMRIWAGLFWRPLLAVGREELREYLAVLGQDWREDPSNSQPVFLRNRVRHELLPLCRELVNPRADEALGRLAGLCAEEEDYWDGWCAAAYEKKGRREGSSLCLDAGYLIELEPVPLRRLLRWALRELTGQSQMSGAGHLYELAQLARGGPGRRLRLPGGVWAYAEHQDLRLDIGGHPPEFAIEFFGPASVYLPWLKMALTAEVVSQAPELRARGPVAHIPLTAVRWPLVIRTPQKGERLQPLGAPGTKRLAKVLADRKVPLWWRRRTVVAADEGGVWWAGPFSLAQRAWRPEPEGPWLRLSFVDTTQMPKYTYEFSENAHCCADSSPTGSLT